MACLSVQSVDCRNCQVHNGEPFCGHLLAVSTMVWPVKLALHSTHCRMMCTFSVTLRVENWRERRAVHVSSRSKPRRPVSRKLSSGLTVAMFSLRSTSAEKCDMNGIQRVKRTWCRHLLEPHIPQDLTNPAVRSSTCKCCFGINRCLGTWPHSQTSVFHLGGSSHGRRRRVQRLRNLLRVQKLFSCKIVEAFLSLSLPQNGRLPFQLPLVGHDLFIPASAAFPGRSGTC